MTHIPEYFDFEETHLTTIDTESGMLFPEIDYVAFDDYQQSVIAFYAEQQRLREERTTAKVSPDLIAAWDRAKHVR